VSIVDQPPPATRGDLAASWDQVVADVIAKYPRSVIWAQHQDLVDLIVSDMRDRDRIGRERYGTPLTAHNGRDQLVDLYQELLDASVYARSAIAEGSTGLVGVYHNLLDNVMNVRTYIVMRDDQTRSK
jgi:hypothetical protein